MPFKTYKNSQENSEITEIFIHYNGKKSCSIIKYADGNYQLHQLYNVLKFLNIPECISVISSDKIMQDSDGLIIKQGPYYSFDEKKALQFFKNYGVIDDIIPIEYSSLALPFSPFTWHKLPAYFDCIAKTAINIIESYREGNIFSLGQTPAWLVKAAQLIPTNCEFSYIPFSGSFYRPISLNNPADESYDSYGELSVHYVKKVEPIYKGNYYGILDDLGLNPKNIIQRNLQDNQKTIILEFTLTGTGLASFLSVLCDRTREVELDINELQKAIEIVILVDKKEETYQKEIILDKTTFKCSHLIVENLSFTSLIWDLANAPDEDRLVPSYKSAEWNHPPKPLTNKKSIEALTETLSNAVTKIYNQHIGDIISSHTPLDQVITSIIGEYVPGELHIG